MNNLVAAVGAPAGLKEHVAGGGAGAVVCSAHEALQQALFAATDDGRLVGVGLEDGDLVLEAPLPPDGSGGVLTLHALAELDAVFAATAGGALLLMHLDTEAWETVGEMEGGMLVASCSPDGELLVCLTRSLTLVALSPSSWEVLTERDLEAATIDVSSQPKIAWRADGQKCAMLARDSVGKSRITVMDRGCAPEFISEPFDNVGTALAFHPDGSLIAASQKIANRHDIIFFEPNALRHYELTLPPERTAATVEDLAWSADGALLAVSLSGAGGDAVQIWHRANYHWYLKYEYVPGAAELSSEPRWTRPSCLWHESDPLSAVLAVGGEDARVFTFTWEWMVSAPYLSAPGASGKEEEKLRDWSTVASIDGKRILLTPLRKMVVPPPMCAATLEVGSPILSAAWGPDGRLALLCSDGSVMLCSCPFENMEWDKPPVVQATFKVAGRLFQLAWPAPRMLAALAFDPKAMLVPIPLPSHADGLVVVPGPAATVKAAGKGPLRLTREIGQGGCVLLQVDGSVHAVSVAGASGAEPSLLLAPATMLAGPCALVADLGAGRGWVGMSKRGKLWWGSQSLAEGVTSMCIHEGRLLLITTASCRLQAYRLDDASAGTTPPSLLCDDGRMLERGAVLVAAPDEDQRVVMSMPRGNLEVLHPQLLVVRRTCALLAGREYLAALSLMRKHKVDMNLLVDYDPPAFFRDALPAQGDASGHPAGPSLLVQLGKQGPHMLSLFIASLRDNSVRDALYPFAPMPPDTTATLDWAALAATTGAAAGKVVVSAGRVVSKVSAVCDLMAQAIRARDDPRLRACMVLTFVRRHPPQIDQALQHLQGCEEAETVEGLEVLLGLVDHTEVWDAALGLYDLTLAAHVAQLAGKDPREYVPLIERLAALPDRHCCYEIDLMLKRYAKAVMHAIRGGDSMWAKAREVTEQHSLYTVAIQNLRQLPARRAHLDEVLTLYGSYLSERGEHKLAGFVLKTAGLTSEATGELQQDATCWEAAMLLLHEQGTESDLELQRRAYTMAEALRLSGDPRGAARLYVDYCSDVDEGVASLSEAREWVEAARVARKGKRADLIATTVLPSLAEAESATAQDIDSRLERLQYIAQRLGAIKAEEEKQRQAREAECKAAADEGRDVDDAASDWSRSQAPSASAKSSRASTHSSRSSRSSKSNKTRSSARVPKEGDPWEEDYLIKARPPLVPTVAFRQGMRRMLESFVIFGMPQQAAGLQAKFAALEDYVKNHDLGGLALDPPLPSAADWKIAFLDAAA